MQINAINNNQQSFGIKGLKFENKLSKQNFMYYFVTSNSDDIKSENLPNLKKAVKALKNIIKKIKPEIGRDIKPSVKIEKYASSGDRLFLNTYSNALSSNPIKVSTWSLDKNDVAKNKDTLINSLTELVKYVDEERTINSCIKKIQWNRLMS